jgi:hypothetical protein
MIFKSSIKALILKILDFTLMPLTVISILWLKFIRNRIVGLWHSESGISLMLFRKFGLFPITDNYYEPLFQTNKLQHPLDKDRYLPGIDLKIESQTNFLKSFNFSNEIKDLASLPYDLLNYNFERGSFRSGDSEILYSMIRFLKPRKIIEIGCGQSSLMIQHACQRNQSEDDSYIYEHICIEPYANAWLEKLNATIIREKVEDVDLSIFRSLSSNDILFIDSSHIIRPQGDVLFEYLQIIPSLNSNVYIHIHDIFTPKDYLKEWLTDGLNFWNEQYLLESFLTNNNSFEIVLGLNYLKHKDFELLQSRCPMLDKSREPGSMWIKRN